jgi:hypothetical protein
MATEVSNQKVILVVQQLFIFSESYVPLNAAMTSFRKLPTTINFLDTVMDH